MSGFYFSITFKTQSQITYFLPLKLKTEDRELARRCYEAMKTAISSRFVIVSEETPMPVIEDINTFYVNTMLNKPFSGKLVRLRVTEWEFTDFEPDLSLNFNQNLNIAMNPKIEELENFGFCIGGNTLARCINEYKFPLQVISNPMQLTESSLLAIELVSAM